MKSMEVSCAERAPGFGSWLTRAYVRPVRRAAAVPLRARRSAAVLLGVSAVAFVQVGFGALRFEVQQKLVRVVISANRHESPEELLFSCPRRAEAPPQSRLHKVVRKGRRPARRAARLVVGQPVFDQLFQVARSPGADRLLSVLVQLLRPSLNERQCLVIQVDRLGYSSATWPTTNRFE